MARAGIQDRIERDSAAKGNAVKTFLLCVAGWFTGYCVSSISSILFFLAAHISPAKPASTAAMTGSAIFGMVFAVIAAIVGASFSRRHALGIGAAIAATIVAAAFFSWYLTPTHAHWSQAIAILLMAPAAQFGAFFRRETD